MARVFISYATPDRAIADEVSGWLRAAGREPFLDHDLHNGISPGEDWKQRLYRELHEVDAVIGVVTKSFVASKWCFAELGIADARGCRLVPLRAKAGVVHPLMKGLWNVADPAHPTALGQPLTGHTDTVWAVAFSPDGRTLASGSADKTVRLWGMNVEQAIQRICAATANTLTRETWARYVSPDLPYRPPCP